MVKSSHKGSFGNTRPAPLKLLTLGHRSCLGSSKLIREPGAQLIQLHPCGSMVAD
jgi:hypothetical protein